MKILKKILIILAIILGVVAVLLLSLKVGERIV